MAKYLFEREAKKASLPVEVSSAGLSAFFGDEMNRNALRALSKVGIDGSEHRSRRPNLLELSEYDYIVCLGEGNEKALLPFVGEEKLLVPDDEISNPKDEDEKSFEKCRDELLKYILKLMNMISQVRILKLESGDVSAVAELERECFSTPWSEKALLESISDESAVFLKAVFCGEIVGYIGSNVICGEGYVTNVAVTKSRRRKGFAEKLLSECERLCREKGAEFLSLEVRKSNSPAIALYEKCGYSVCGERKNFYSEPRENGLIMTKYFGKTD